MSKETDNRQELVDKIIKKMEDAVKYEKPWFENNAFPYNPVTGTKYKGINILSLMSADFPDPRFYTFNNIKALAEEMGTTLKLKKGSEGIPVFKAIQVPVNSKEADNDETGEGRVGDGKSSQMIWIQKTAGYVFNASQIEGLPPLTVDRKTKHNSIEAAEKVMEAMKQTGLKIEHHTQGKAFYRPSTDSIGLPEPEQFKSSEMYYRTLMHEIGHSTGHESRLNRDQKNEFGSKKYAYEELIAELTSYFIGNEIGLPYDPQTHENHAAYLKGWISALKDDKSFLFKAAAQANKAADYQINLVQVMENKVDIERAAKCGDCEGLKRLIDNGVSVNACNVEGNTALHIAMKNNQLDAAKVLLDAGANPDVENVRKERPFELVSPHVFDVNENTALHYAASVGSKQDVLSLVQRGASLDIENANGNTPLDIAEQVGNTAVLSAISSSQSQQRSSGMSL